ncbi:unnamed protein product, partial [Amoebophrya sp. A25]
GYTSHGVSYIDAGSCQVQFPYNAVEGVDGRLENGYLPLVAGETVRCFGGHPEEGKGHNQYESYCYAEKEIDGTRGWVPVDCIDLRKANPKTASST